MKHLYRITAATLITFCTAAFLPGDAPAADFTVDGLNYTLLSATDRTCSLAPGDYQGELVIPATVTFNGRELTVIAVDEDAIYNLPELTGVQIGPNVASFGRHAFCLTPKLEKIVIPANVKRIEPFSFVRAGVKELVIEQGENPSDRLEIGVSDYSQRIGWPSAGTFLRCTQLEKVTIRRQLSQITSTDYVKFTSPFCPTSAFNDYNCPVKEVVLGGDAEVSYKLFFMCYDVEKITFEEGISEIGESSFYQTAITELTFPSSMRTVGESAFGMCEKLAELELNNGLETLEMSCFGNTALTEVVIPESVTSWAPCFGADVKKLRINSSCTIGGLWNSDIEDLTFGPHVTKVDNPNYFRDSTLNTITVESAVPPTATGEFTSAQYLNSTLRCPTGSVDLYREAPVWKNFWNIEGVEIDGVESVIADLNQSIEYYTLDGMRLSTEPTEGLYLRKTGHLVEKIYR